MAWKCVLCRKGRMIEVHEKILTQKVKGAIIVQCDSCQRYLMRKFKDDSVAFAPIASADMVDCKPDCDHNENDLFVYLEANGWQKIFNEMHEFIGWYHSDISPMKNRYYEGWQAQAIQNAIDDFLYSHLRKS
jgi:hypothetical protein